MTFLFQAISWSFKGVKALKSIIDRDNEERFEKARDAEGCPHIEMISGFTQPYNDMLAHVGKNGGIAWKNDDGNPHWYWHPQENFKPLEYTEVVIGRKMKTPSKIDGKNCERCLLAIKERG